MARVLPSLVQPKRTVIDASFSMSGKMAERFAEEARRRNRTPAALAADLLETIVRDDLFSTVLDT